MTEKERQQEFVLCSDSTQLCIHFAQSPTGMWPRRNNPWRNESGEAENFVLPPPPGSQVWYTDHQYSKIMPTTYRKIDKCTLSGRGVEFINSEMGSYSITEQAFWRILTDASGAEFEGSRDGLCSNDNHGWCWHTNHCDTFLLRSTSFPAGQKSR